MILELLVDNKGTKCYLNTNSIVRFRKFDEDGTWNFLMVNNQEYIGKIIGVGEDCKASWKVIKDEG